MKLKTFWMISTILMVIAVAEAQVAQTTLSADELKNHTPAASRLADLVVLSVEATDMDGGQVTATVKNQGLLKAERSDVMLKLRSSSSEQQLFTQTHSAPPLYPGQTTEVVIETKMGLAQLNYCATADSMRKVPEANESNNRRCGRFGGKP